MAGGLITIINAGCQDLYLIGNPEITHFKCLYRRHTNFAMESIKVPMDDEVGFNMTSHVILPRAGDLISRIYMEVEIPEVCIKKCIMHSDQLKINKIIKLKKELKRNFELLINFINKITKINITAYRNVVFDFENPQIKTCDIIDELNEYFTNYIDDIDKFNKCLNGKFDTNIIIMNCLANNFYIDEEMDEKTNKNNLITSLKFGVENNKNLLRHYTLEYQKICDEITDHSCVISNFAWIKKLGHFMIDYIDVFIGGEKIDRQTGEWLDVWYELSGNKHQIVVYDTMIGNVPELYEFNNKIKPKYCLLIPFQFWFCRNYGSSIPYIGLEFCDVSFEIKLKRLIDCCYTENPDVVPDINIYYNLYVDYVYLDACERKLFAQCKHEYLVDITEYTCISDICEKNFSFNLEIWNPCKELIWIFRKDNKEYWNYGITECGKINPMLSARMDFNGYTRIPLLDGNYFNYLQPYVHHRNAPRDGINVYSFSLKPEEQQPTGHCNFTRITSPKFHVEMHDCFIDTSFEMRLFARTLNVLRMCSGIGSLAFV